MAIPEYLTPENGWMRMRYFSPFDDGRILDIYRHQNELRSQYAIYADEEAQGEIIYTHRWYPLSNCILHPGQLEIIYILIEKSELRPEIVPEPYKSDAELRLNHWLDIHGYYPGNYDRQCMVINSFYEEVGEDIEDEWEKKIAYASKHFDLFEVYVAEMWRD